MFQLAQIWCKTATEEQYARFLDRLFEQITSNGGLSELIMDGAEYRLAEIEAIENFLSALQNAR